ncbi:septal ring lytic transglycosylase RlpA family protein [Egbenema bharatensis]|uniref:septal ring lytic transglycosylase RlpA family protein n=1 Tax=Egbenema bharatensis TaxID=3463334 RepID=UPI003A84E4F6
MSQKLWSGLTAVTLLVTTMGIAPLSYANQAGSEDGNAEAQVPTQEPSTDRANADSAQPASEPVASQSDEVVKVGEYQSEAETDSEATITEIFPHETGGRDAATLYVRNIPVLTFLSSEETSSVGARSESASSSSTDSEVKVASVQNHSSDRTDSSTTNVSVTRSNAATESGAETENADSNEPVWRATSLAARLNQLYRDGVDADAIRAEWDSQQQRYLIKVGDDELVEINSDTVLPHTTQDLAEDTVQITNLLRRLLGDAPPIQSVAGDPRYSNRISVGPVQVSISGMASWYGPGFHGNYSASGEVFNENALTAAHRTLPFGTQVRVTNMDNGLSVVVRINDRGRFHGNRVIDLSTAAARSIGLVQSGVAPVNVEVLGATQSASSTQE